MHPIYPNFVMFELDVFKLLIRGLTTEQIAEQLDVSVSVVLYTRKMVLLKTETHKRKGLVKFAQAHNIPLT